MSKDTQRLEEKYMLSNMAGAIKATATSILLYLSEAYFRAVKDHFAEFWPPLLHVSGSFPTASWEKTLLCCSAGCRQQVCQWLREKEEYREEPMLQSPQMLEAALKAVDTRRISEILRSMPVAVLKEMVQKDIQGASEETVRRFLHTLDIAAFFKMNYAIPQREQIYQWLAAVYPGVAQCTQQEWSGKNDQAVRLRNRLDGHLALEDLQKLDPAEWRQKCDVWLDICGSLCNEQMKKEYQDLCWAVKRSARTASYVAVSIDHLAKVDELSVESVEKILREMHFEIHDGHVFCESEGDALRAISEYSIHRRMERVVLQQQRRIEELLQQQPQLSVQEVESQVIRTMLENRMTKLKHLGRYERGLMNAVQLRELVETHMIVVDGSVLKNKVGREFLMKDLLPFLSREKNEKAEGILTVEATTRYRIYQEREECRKAGISGSEAQAAYITMEDGLRKSYGVLRYVNTPNPTLTDEEALIEFVRTHSMRRICILTCGASSLAQKIDREAAPLCVVARLMRVPRNSPIMSRSGYGCMIFEHMLPFAQDAQDPALTQRLVEKYHQDKAAQLRPAGEVMKPEEASSVGHEAKTASEMDPQDRTYLQEILKLPLPAEEKNARKQALREQEEKLQEDLKKAQEQKKQNKSKERTAFAADAELRKLSGKLLPLSRPVQQGDILRTSNGVEIQISAPLMEKSVTNSGAEQVAEGGEGTLYVTDFPGQVAKLYHREQLTEGRHQKLKAMMETRMGIREVCWPSTLLYQKDGQFVGYLMPQAPKGARPLGLSVLQLSKAAVQNGEMADWDRVSLVRTAKAIANAMSVLHGKNILMGDVNAANFLIVPEDGRSVRKAEDGTMKPVKAREKMKVYLVDCDSYQFDGYPCPVGTEVYTHPGTGERLGIKGPLQFGTFLRTKEEEQYALAILLFQILMLGQSPFSNKTGMSFTEAMKQRIFPYTQEEAEDVPEGDAWMIWKNLTKNIQNAFLQVFKEWKPVSAQEWVKLLDGYLVAIEKSNFSRELIPTKYVEYNKEDPIYVDLVCSNCGKEFNKHKKWVASRRTEAERMKKEARYFCGVCTGFLEINRSIPVDLTCEKCGKTYTGTMEQGYMNHKFQERLLCQECLHPTTTCMICGSSFVTTLWKLENRTVQQCDSCLKMDKTQLVHVQCEQCGSHENMEKGRIMHARFQKEPLLCGSCLRRRRYL